MRISDWSSDVCSSDLKKLDRIKSGLESANTFEAVAKEWLALKDWEDVTKKRRLDMLARVVFPHIGKLPLRQIVPEQILDILNRPSKANGLSVADEARRTMSYDRKRTRLNSSN